MLLDLGSVATPDISFLPSSAPQDPLSGDSVISKKLATLVARIPRKTRGTTKGLTLATEHFNLSMLLFWQGTSVLRECAP